MGAFWQVWTRVRTSAQRQPAVRWVVRTALGFWNDDCLTRASSLTYTTSLAVVPLLAVVLALLKGAGYADTLRPFLLARFPVVEPDAIDQLLAYIDRANAQAIGGIGMVALLISAWVMLSGVENALNHIFGVRSGRGPFRRMAEFPAMIFGGAAAVVVTFTAQTLLGAPDFLERAVGPEIAQGATGFALSLLPWLLPWVAFTFLYAWMPNTRLPVGRAVFGGLLGGTLFQLVQMAYIELQLGFARYHAVYGALATLPIVLVWIYASWCVALLSAQAVATLGTLHVEPELAEGELPPELLALEVLRRVGRAFRRGEPTPGAAEIGVALAVPPNRVRDAVAPLLEHGILVEPDGEHGYLPAVSPESVSLEGALAALDRRARIA